MGVYNYILDRQKNELYELGKGLYPYNLFSDIDLYLSDRLAFKYTLLYDISENFPDWTISSCMKLTESIWSFCKDRKDLILTSEHFLYDGYIDYNCCKLVFSVYGNEEETTDRWRMAYEKKKAKEDPEQFVKFGEYLRLLTH